jgi:transcriptional regulator with XRE-family HTH domain
MKYEDNLMRERIQKLMHREGLSQREFADKIGRLPANVSQILTGERNIPRNLCKQISEAFPKINR